MKINHHHLLILLCGTFQLLVLVDMLIDLNFYFDKLTSRWWIEILSDESNTKLSEKTLLPCTREDYEQANNGIIPDRWLKAIKKNIL